MRSLGGSITVAAVGRVKEGHWRAAQDDYRSRLARYFDFQAVEVKDGGGGEKGGAAEAHRLLDATRNGGRRVALTPEGRTMDSPSLARQLRRWLDAFQKVSFLIGGPEGLHEEALRACDDRFSLSPMTFPHELARIILLEQLYRAATILNGEKYHK